MSGVAGFIGAGSRVDVILSGSPTSGNIEMAKVILENMVVASAGQNVANDAMADPERSVRDAAGDTRADPSPGPGSNRWQNPAFTSKPTGHGGGEAKRRSARPALPGYSRVRFRCFSCATTGTCCQTRCTNCSSAADKSAHRAAPNPALAAPSPPEVMASPAPKGPKKTFEVINGNEKKTIEFD